MPLSIVPTLPYDILQGIFATLPAVDLLSFLRTSRLLYYPLRDDDTTWRTHCTPYGVTDRSSFGGRSFRTIYGRLLHPYGALLGLWASDHPMRGGIIEFRLVQDHWQRGGEHIIVGNAWKFDGPPATPEAGAFNRVEFLQIGFAPTKSVVDSPRDTVHLSWHLRSEHNLGYLNYHEESAPPYVRLDGGAATPALHVLSPAARSLVLTTYLGHSKPQPEFPAGASDAWYDPDRGLPRLLMKDTPPPGDVALRPPGQFAFVHGNVKPAALVISLPPADAHSEVRVPYLFAAPHSYLEPTREDPRYYPLRTTTSRGIEPTSPDWSADSVVGLWLGDYGPHGTECVWLEHARGTDGDEIVAWKITGDVNVPRGTTTWRARLGDPVQTDSEGRDGAGPERAYAGTGQIAHHGFNAPSNIAAVVCIASADEIIVRWEDFFANQYVRYRERPGRVGEETRSTSASN